MNRAQLLEALQVERFGITTWAGQHVDTEPDDSELTTARRRAEMQQDADESTETGAA